jgi:hypothetical protein
MEWIGATKDRAVQWLSRASHRDESSLALERRAHRGPTRPVVL